MSAVKIQHSNPSGVQLMRAATPNAPSAKNTAPAMSRSRMMVSMADEVPETMIEVTPDMCGRSMVGPDGREYWASSPRTGSLPPYEFVFELASYTRDRAMWRAQWMISASVQDELRRAAARGAMS